MKDKRISHTDGFSVLVAAQSSAKQPSKFAQAPESFTAATENGAGSYKTPASGSVSWPWLGEVKAAAEMWQQSATDTATCLPLYLWHHSSESSSTWCQASFSRLESHILKKKPRERLLKECFLKPLQTNLRLPEIWLHTKMLQGSKAVHHSEQNKDKTIPITPNVRIKQILPATAFFSKIILLPTFGSNKQEN